MLDLTPLIDAIVKASKPTWIEYLTVLGLIFAGLGAFLAGIQIRIARKAANSELEKRRRENAVAALLTFAESAKPEYQGLSRLMRDVSKGNLEKLKIGDVFSIPSGSLHLLTDLLTNGFPSREFPEGKHEGENYALSQEQASAVKHVAAENLNRTETVLIPAFTGVADQTIVIEQMKPYFQGLMKDRMENLRKAFGREALPNTFRMMDLTEEAEQENGKTGLTEPLTV